MLNRSLYLLFVKLVIYLASEFIQLYILIDHFFVHEQTGLIGGAVAVSVALALGIRAHRDTRRH